MKERFISGIVMAVIVVFLAILGGWAWNIFVCLIATLALRELLNIKKDLKVPKIVKFISFASMIMLTLSNIGTYSTLFGLSYKTISLVFLLLLIPTIFLRKQKYTINDAFYISAITIFLGIVFNLFITVYNDSIKYLIYIALVAMATDIFALFGGKLIGKRKFTKISPSKTIEGCVVGSIIGVIISTTYYVTFISADKIVLTIFISLLLSIVGQIGDLFFSLIKRENNVKDFSNLIPGHGGILDRIDSIIFILLTFIFISQFI